MSVWRGFRRAVSTVIEAAQSWWVLIGITLVSFGICAVGMVVVGWWSVVVTYPVCFLLGRWVGVNAWPRR